MVDLKDYFDPVDKKLRSHSFSEGTYGKMCLIKNFPKNLKGFQIALLGIPETRNANSGSFDAGTDLIRSYFYKLAEIPNLDIVDLGNLKSGNTVKDTYVLVEEIITKLLSKNITPVIIGGSQEVTVPIVKAIAKENEECELSVIDAKIDADDEEFHSNSFLNYINNKDNPSTLISIIGYQSYFIPIKFKDAAIEKGWNLYKLGAIRNNFNKIEPILRDSDIVSFDISAVRQSENPGASFSSPNGLYSEEACQLANLSGLSDKLKVFSLFEYKNAFDINNQSAHLSAQIIWHFLFGFSQRKNDYPKKALDSYKKIYVKLEKTDSDLVFYKNIENRRFWVEIPTRENNKNKVISCSEDDYKKACNNEIPDRIWQNISRFLK